MFRPCDVGARRLVARAMKSERSCECWELSQEVQSTQYISANSNFQLMGFRASGTMTAEFIVIVIAGIVRDASHTPSRTSKFPAVS